MTHPRNGSRRTRLQAMGAGLKSRVHLSVLSLIGAALTDDEMRAVADDLAEEHTVVSTSDIAAAVLFVTDILPRPIDIARVGGVLETKGIPVYDDLSQPGR